MDEIVKKFWDKWIVADELERITLVKTLSRCNGDPSVINSYFEDLEQYINEVRE